MYFLDFALALSGGFYVRDWDFSGSVGFVKDHETYIHAKITAIISMNAFVVKGNI